MEEEKVFITGRTSIEEDKDGKVIFESMMTFDEAPKKLWIKFPSIEEYVQKERVLSSILALSEGNDRVVIYCEKEKQQKPLPANQNVKADDRLLESLKSAFGESNIKVT